MKQRFESVQGAWTYWTEIELDQKKPRVIVRSGQHVSKEPVDKGKKKIHKFESREKAAKYFRYELSRMRWELVGGDEVGLDPEEDFKDVKYKSADYRYFEHSGKKEFWDIDRDLSRIIMWEGPVGKKGGKTVEEFNWDGEAKDFYKEQAKKREGEGFCEISEAGISLLEGLEREFGKVPKAYRTFLEGGDFSRYSGKYVAGLPMYPGDTKFKVYFDKTDVIDGAYQTSWDKDRHPDLFPFCMLGKENLCLAMDRKAPHPVWVAFQSDSPVKLSDSFEAFLSGLFKTAGASPYQRLKKGFEKAEKLRQQKKHPKALKLIDPLLALFPPRQKSKDYFDESDDLENVLAASYNLKGLCLQTAERYSEAVTEYENSIRVMAIGAGSSSKLNLLETYAYRMQDYDAALKFADSFEAYDAYTRYYQAKAAAFSALAKGNVEDARARYQKVLSAIKEDKKTSKQRRESVAQEIQEDYLDAGLPHQEAAREMLALFA